MEKTAAVVTYHQLVDPQGAASGGRLASLIINRPEAANSFNGELLEAMTAHLKKIAQDPTVRLLLVQSSGKHFSAGADLNWMRESAQLGEESNRREAEKLTAMFESLSHLPMPSLALVKGAAYGGAVGIIACCDYAVATEDARFCLSEVRVGLIPAVILPYLSRKMRPGDLRRLALSGQVFSAEDAIQNGLIQAKVSSAEELDPWLRGELKQILAASPDAQKAYKQLQYFLDEHHHSQGLHTADAIAKIRASTSGQQGLQSFFEKKMPPWLAMPADEETLVQD